MPGAGLARENTILWPSGEKLTSKAATGGDPSGISSVISARRGEKFEFKNVTFDAKGKFKEVR